VDSKNRLLFISDSSRHIIIIADIDGNIKNEIRYDMNYPIDIDIIPEERKLYVLDSLNYQVKVFDYDGVLLKSFGKIGNTPGSFSKPKGICIDRYKRVYVSDADFDNIQIFSEDGDVLYFLGGTGIEPDKFYLIGKLYCFNDEIYVSDIYNSRVKLFKSYK